MDEQVGEEEEEYEANPKINTRVPIVVEIKKALKELRNGKAAGVHNISLEVMTVDLDITANMLHPLFEKIWTEGEIPNDWKCGLLVKLPKKGDTTNCDNWRGITLLSEPSKVLTSVLLKRITEHVNLRLQKEQAGFRPNRSCIDQINTLRAIIEQCIEWSCGSLSPRHGASSVCGWRNGLQYRKVAVNKLNNKPGQPTRGGPPACCWTRC